MIVLMCWFVPETLKTGFQIFSRTILGVGNDEKERFFIYFKISSNIKIYFKIKLFIFFGFLMMWLFSCNHEFKTEEFK